MHSIKVLRFIGSCPGGAADLKTLETKFGSVPQAHLDYLVQRGLIDYQLDFVGDELDIVGYKLTVQGQDALSTAQEKARQRSEDVSDRRAQQHSQQAESERAVARERANTRLSWFQFFAGLILGWLLGLVTPLDIWFWIQSLFH